MLENLLNEMDSTLKTGSVWLFQTVIVSGTVYLISIVCKCYWTYIVPEVRIRESLAHSGHVSRRHFESHWLTAVTSHSSHVSRGHFESHWLTAVTWAGNISSRRNFELLDVKELYVHNQSMYTPTPTFISIIKIWSDPVPTHAPSNGDVELIDLMSICAYIGNAD
jgi:hypothetical protein